MTDYPAGAFVTGNGVKTTALQFKTCIYKASEVPAKTVRDNVNFATPIHCFEWQNIYVFDFAKGVFETKLPEQEGVPEVAPQPNYLLLVSSVLLIAGLLSAWWFKRRFFSPDVDLL